MKTIIYVILILTIMLIGYLWLGGTPIEPTQPVTQTSSTTDMTPIEMSSTTATIITPTTTGSLNIF